MAFVAVAATVGGVVGLSGTAAIIGGGALIGAGVGGLYSGITGDGNILNSMLTGGLIGGAGAFGLNAMGVGAGTTASTSGLTAASGAKGAMGAGSALQLAPTAATSAYGGLGASAVPSVAGTASLAAPGVTSAGGLTGLTASQVPSLTSSLGSLGPASAGMTGGQMLGYGLAGTAAMSLLGGMNQPKLSTSTGVQNPSEIRPYTYSSTFNPSAYPSGPQYGADGLPILPGPEKSFFTQNYTAGTPYAAANGGLMAVGGPVERMTQNMMGGQGNMYPLSQQDHTNFATPTQMPASAEVIRSDYDAKTQPYTGVMMAEGGITYDAATQTYSGLPQMGPSATGDVTPLSADLIAQLTPQYQSANPNAFSYDAKNQRYGAANPTMAQLNAFKAEQDRIAAEQSAAQAQQQQQDYGQAGGANGGLMPKGLRYANGGALNGQYNLGGYSDGGRLLKGPGDGVSDDIPATIAGKQPARLADGEFVIPARIVSELGNGSTDAGAKRLYAMMDNIQAGRKKSIGKNNVAKDTKAKKHLLA